jgi:hypothetical protein
MEAGKDLYSLQTPGAEIARALLKTAQGKFKADLAASSKLKRDKVGARAARAAVLEAGRIAASKPTAQTSILDYVHATPVSSTPGEISLLGPTAVPVRNFIPDFFRPMASGGPRALSPVGPSFLSELSTPDPLVSPVVCLPVPSQEVLYDQAVCRYSSTRIKTLLADRSHLHDQLWYALNRFASIEFARWGSFDVPVPLREVMDDTDSRAAWALRHHGVLWSDVLCRLRISFAGWLSLTSDVRDHYRRIFGELHPGDGPRGVVGLDIVPRPIPPISKRFAELVSRNQEPAAAP